MKFRLSILLTSFLFFSSCKKDEQNIAIQEFDFTEEMIDGTAYKCIVVGDQVWMAENLRTRIDGGRGAGSMTFNEELVLNAPKDKVQAALIASLENGVFNINATFQSNCDRLIRRIIIPAFFTPNGGSYSMKWENYSELYKSRPLNRFDLPYFNLIEIELLRIMEIEKNKAIIAAADTSYIRDHGYLYTFAASKKVIPTGWRIPTDEDWLKLEKSIGMSGQDLKQMDVWRGKIGASMKKNPLKRNFNGTFSGAYIYGKSQFSDNFVNKDLRGYWWSSTKLVDADTASTYIIRGIRIDNDQVLRGSSRMDAAYSIRLVKDK